MHDSLEPGVVIKLRRDTTINWATDNPVLAVGETGWDTDLLKVKLGDGVTAWNDLPYAIDGPEGEVDTVAGVGPDGTNDVPAANLKTALNLPSDTATALTNEATARANADTALATSISNETTTRGNADTTLQNNINAEAALARNADNLTSGTVAEARLPTRLSATSLGASYGPRAALSARAAYDVSRSIGNARLSYDTASSFTESWANTTAWAGTGVQVSGGKAYAAAAGFSTGINHGWRVAPGETARVVWKVNFVASPSSGMAIGFDHSAVGATPGTGGNNMTGLFFRNTNVIQVLTDGAQGSSIFTSMGTSTWTVTMVVDENYLTMFATSTGGAVPRVYYRWARDDTNRPLNNLTVLLNDNRALSGCSVEPITESRLVPSGTVGLPTGATLTGGVTGHWGSHSGDNFLLMFPNGYDTRRPTRAAICFHGNGTDETFWTTNANAKAVADAFLADGYIVIGAANTGLVSTWGAQAGLDAYTRAYQYARDHYNIGSLVVFGNSMGSIEGMNVLNQEAIPGVSAQAYTVPAYNLAAAHADATFTATIDTAYGGNYAVNSVGHDPALMDAVRFRGLPTWVLYATDDTVLPPATHAVPFINAMTAIGITPTVVTATGGHSTSAVATNAAAMVAYLSAANGYVSSYPA